MTIPYPALDEKKALGKSGVPFRVYGLWGDAFLQEQTANFLLDLLVEPDARDFNLDILDGETAKIPEVLAACANFPFLSDRRVIYVRRAEKLEGLARAEDSSSGAKKKKTPVGASPAQKLAAGLDALPATTALILARTPETPEVGEKGSERCLNAALDKIIDANGLLVNCVITSKNQGLAVSIIEFQARAREIPLAKGAAQFLVERCGTGVAFLLGELEKCALMAGAGVPVTAQIITEMTRPTLHNTVFDLLDAIGNREGTRALQMLRDLFVAGQPPHSIVALIARHVRQLLQARTFLDANLPLDATLKNRLPPDLAAQLPREFKDNLALSLHVNAWLGNRLGAQARRFSVAQLARALELIFAADLALKGIEGDGGFDARMKPDEATLEILVAKLCGI